MTAKYEIGDVVHLNSGGPSMTVIGLLDDEVLDVAWFIGGETGAYEYQGAAFHQQCVRTVTVQIDGADDQAQWRMARPAGE